eukprot:1732350-Rhodomonas_salina.3
MGGEGRLEGVGHRIPSTDPRAWTMEDGRTSMEHQTWSMEHGTSRIEGRGTHAPHIQQQTTNIQRRTRASGRHRLEHERLLPRLRPQHHPLRFFSDATTCARSVPDCVEV